MWILILSKAAVGREDEQKGSAENATDSGLTQCVCHDLEPYCQGGRKDVGRKDRVSRPQRGGTATKSRSHDSAER